jgi:hypothetical protein
MPRMYAVKWALGPLLLVSISAMSAEPLTLDALRRTAYRTSPDLAAEADRSYARAVAIGESRFTQGTAKEFDAALERAAILGHVGAADLKCTMRSNPVLGFAFLREGYAWCHIAMTYFKDADPEDEQRVAATWAAVVEKLGPQNRPLGEQYEQFTLHRMLEAARPGSKPANR